MTQPESKLSSNIRKALLPEGAFVFKVHGSVTMMSGLPDLIGCYRGKFFGLEVKMPDKRNNSSKRQVYVKSLIRKAGGVSEVVTSKEEALEVLKQIPSKANGE